MLRISKIADYGMLVMNFLAKQAPACFSASAISDQVKVNLPTVGKTLKILSEAGLLQSQRGTHGGYQLAKPAQQITIAEIIQAIDGKPALTECAMQDSECSIQHDCSLQGNWQFINDIVFDVLNKVSLSDMGQRINEEKVVPIRFYKKESQV